MTLNRRTFLQGASLTLGALGLAGGSFLWPTQYAQALGKPARRKLALLIGINQYPDRAVSATPGQEVALKGCLTDVDMQRQLLIHRFGFAPQDILTLTNQAATRQGIVNALDQHLVDQAQADDVVLLHFSGYGSQVRWDGNPNLTYRTWVPVDGRLPSSDQPALNDLLEVEIAAILRRIATPNLTTVIDAGSQDTGYLRWGNMKVRSRPIVPVGNLPEPFLGMVEGAREGETPWPGLLLRANNPGNLVLEGPWDGFSAGLFTYALTQSLWEAVADPNPKLLIQRVGDRIQHWTGPDQVPTLGNVLAPKAVTMPYSLPPDQPNAVGIAQPTDPRTLDLWLGGLSPDLLHYLQPGSRFTIPNPSAHDTATPTDAVAPNSVVPDPVLDLRLESRSGLHGVAKPVMAEVSLPAQAQPLYEKVRVLPTNLTLTMALDSQLKRVERVDATSALAGVPFVTAIAAGERNADCLFGRLPVGPGGSPADGDRFSSAGSERLTESSYGLFAPNRTLVPGTMLAKEEAVKTALTRLTPTLRSLLALKLVRLTQNRFASGLAALVAVEAVGPKPTVLLRQQTEASRLTHPGLTDPGSGPTTLTLSRDARFQYRITNHGEVPLYVMVIRFNGQGDCSALVTPVDLSRTEDIALTEDNPPNDLPLAPRQTLLIPNNPNGWGILGAATRIETHIILSAQPFAHSLEVLTADGAMPPVQTELQRVSQPLKFAQALLQDLHSDAALPEGRNPGEVYALDHHQWATFHFNYVVNSP